MASSKRTRILNVPVDMVDSREAMEIFRRLMKTKDCSLIVTPNSEIIVNATKDLELKNIIEQADLIIPDGIGLVYASKIMGVPLKERVTGIDFLNTILGSLEGSGQSIFFLGSRPGDGELPGIAETAAERMKETYTKLKVAGTHHGYFKEADEEAIVKAINDSGADFLCVALGSPKQEKFVYRHRDALKVKAAIGVGGSLDVWAGTLKRAPEFYRNHGLEWLYRLIQQPSRYKRMAALPLFMIKVVFNRFRGGKKRMAIDYEKLKKIARDIRIDIIKETYHAGSGHPGGSLSAADIMTVLYFHELNIDPANLQKEARDKFVLSKGHATPVLYAALAHRGFFPKDDLVTFRKIGSRLQGHPDMKKVPGVEMSTGSLGQGFSVSVGMAIANKLDQKEARVYALLGDGELQEGIIWEAAMSAAHYKLDNLTAIVDWNGLQIDGKNDDVMMVAPVDEKFESFGFHVICIDGHNMEEIVNALAQARETKGKPTAIIAKTVKGKGVSFMENNAGWHGKAPSEEEAKKAIAELGGKW